METLEEQTLGAVLAAEHCLVTTSTCQSLTRTAKHERPRYHLSPLRMSTVSSQFIPEPLQHCMFPESHWSTGIAGSAGGIRP